MGVISQVISEDPLVEIREKRQRLSGQFGGCVNAIVATAHEAIAFSKLCNDDEDKTAFAQIESDAVITAITEVKKNNAEVIAKVKGMLNAIASGL